MSRLGPLLIATVIAVALGAIAGTVVGWIGGWIWQVVFGGEVGFLRSWLFAAVALALAMWVPWVVGIMRNKAV